MMAKSRVDLENVSELDKPTLIMLYEAYSKFGEESTEKDPGILLSQCDLWMEQAKIISRQLSTLDTGRTFNKFRKRRLNFEEFNKYVAILCELKMIEIEDFTNKLIDAGFPSTPAKMN